MDRQARTDPAIDTKVRDLCTKYGASVFRSVDEMVPKGTPADYGYVEVGIGKELKLLIFDTSAVAGGPSGDIQKWNTFLCEVRDTVGTGGGAVGGIGKEFAASRTSNLVRFGSYFTERG